MVGPQHRVDRLQTDQPVGERLPARSVGPGCATAPVGAAHAVIVVPAESGGGLAARQSGRRGGEITRRPDLDGRARCRVQGLPDRPQRGEQVPPHVQPQRRHGLTDGGDGGLARCQGLPGRAEETPAGGGEFDRCPAPVEQPDPELAFQPGDPLGQPLLGQGERLRRPAEVQVLGGREEGAHLGEIEIHPAILTDNQRLAKPGSGCWTTHRARRSNGIRSEPPAHAPTFRSTR